MRHQPYITNLGIISLLLAFALPVLAQSPVTYQYVYDDAGRVTEAIDSSGNALQYVYDAAGNLTAIQRMTGVQVGITGASTQSGMAGQQVTFTGFGFGGGACVQSVTFNGVAASIVSSTATSVTVTIPVGATSGPVKITTCNGTAVSMFTFVIGSVVVSPSSVTLQPGDLVQFSAAVLPSGSSQAVTWSVDGIVGGSVAVGMITATGLYTAPLAASGSVDVRATSVALPALYGEALVLVIAPNDAYTAFSPGVSVRRGPGTVLQNSTALYVFSPGVSVIRGGTGTGAAGTLYILSLPVSVMLGATGTGGDNQPQAFGLSPGVSLQFLNATMSNNVAALYVLNPGGSVQNEPQGTQALPVRSATKLAVTALSPTKIAPGASGVVTLAGMDMEDTQAVAFVDDAGRLDPRIAIQSASVTSDGRAMTLHLSVSRQATPGRRRVIFWTLPPGKSAVP